jgi:aldehyde dehydrogenase (NAD+)
LQKLVAEYFSPEFFTVVTGAIPVASALLEQKYDHIVYTGGSYGGRIVAMAAAKTLTPYTLELGGKNPCVIDTRVSDATLELFAKRIMWGKFSNGGQICVGSDHVVIVGPPEQEEKFLAYAKKATNAFSKGNHMSRIINEAHFGRLESLLSGTNGQVVHGGVLDREELKIEITIVKNVEPADALMSDEIFGPLLPVLRVDTLDQAVNLIRQSETPLALYIFSL